MTIRCSIFLAISLDGFIARKDGALDWLASGELGEEHEDYGYREFIDSVDTLVVGRKTYERAISFAGWPPEGKKVVVLSRHPLAARSHAPHPLERRSGPPLALLEGLSQEGSRHVYIDGGRTVQGFLQAGLIDEITLTYIPVLLGEGIRLFGSLKRDLRFHHLETKVYRNGFVKSRYQADS